MIT
ncbi:hypothetical protein YPPY92_4378, partial [Yersinia pestis PY-92]|jgi:hypothetical protein